MRTDLITLLSGGDLRSIGQSNAAVKQIHSQEDFDELFKCLYSSDRLIAMRAADCIEKITFDKPIYLNSHKKQILDLAETAENKEVVWHLAQLLPRLNLTRRRLEFAWSLLSRWVSDETASRIVRVNSLQSLYDLSRQHSIMRKRFNGLLSRIEMEKVPSLNARIKKIKKEAV